MQEAERRTAGKHATGSEGRFLPGRALGVRLEHWAYRQGLLSPRALSLPHFLGIGAVKAGTTWLYRNLRCHPELYLPHPKEVHYFDQRFDRGLRFYAGKFEDGRARVRGEITPAYSALPPDRIRFIRSVMPDLKLIFLMRNPVDRAWSHALMDLV